MIPKIKLTVKIVGKESDILITNSESGYKAAMTLFDKSSITWREEALLICLNSGNKPIGWVRLSSGGVSGTVMDPKVIFTHALNTPGTSAIMIFHNHPSERSRPSEADIILTRKIKESAKLLDITFLDHIICTINNNYYSFADEGIL